MVEYKKEVRRVVFCFDLDGTLTQNSGFGVSELNIPWFILWIVLFFYKPRINQETLCNIRKIREKGGKIVIVTARPKEVERITRQYLKKRSVPYNFLVFVGPGPLSGQKKVLAAQKRGGRYFYDNNENTVKLARKIGMKAYQVKKAE